MSIPCYTYFLHYTKKNYDNTSRVKINDTTALKTTAEDSPEIVKLFWVFTAKVSVSKLSSSQLLHRIETIEKHNP